MLKVLNIGNFKGWKDTGTIQMSPITLFFGSNSSGKSSIGQFLMMLKQTIESPDRRAVLFPGDNNSAVQLGSFQEMVFSRSSQKSIFFGYEWVLPERLFIRDVISGERYHGDRLLFTCNIGVDPQRQRALVVNNMEYTVFFRGSQTLAIGLSRDSDKAKYDIVSFNYVLLRQKGRPGALKHLVRFYGFPDELVGYYQNAEFAQQLNLKHEQLFKSLCYLGPLRTKAERLYTWSGNEPESVGYSGENTIAAILASRSRRISLGYKRPYKLLEEVVALKLKEMGLIRDFQVKPISDNRQEYEVKVRTKGSQEFVDLPDVGFGVSQVLPVLVQCFYAPPGSIIIMEQPEIHLHPRAQSALADVMIDVINSKEDGNPRNIQLIIETHSEHFLRRLQRRIAEDKVEQDRVSAYFANVDRNPATLDSLEIDEYGNIKNWPKNFFGDEMGDVTGQAKAAMKKRMEKVGAEERGIS